MHFLTFDKQISESGKGASSFIMQNSYAWDSQVIDGELGHGIRFHISLMIEGK